MIQSSSTLEIAAPLWLILLITSLRVSRTASPLLPPEPHQKRRDLCAIRFLVITKVSCLGTDSPTALDIQLAACRTEVSFYISVATACTLFSGGGRRPCGFAKQHVPVLELTPNESLQSPPSKKGSGPPPLCFSQLIQLSPCLTTRWPSSSPPPPHPPPLQ